MAFILVHHRVKDFDTWKKGFEEHGAARKKAGSRGGHLFRRSDDANDVVVLLEWDSVDSARSFAESPDLPALMAKHGVVGQPEILYLEEDSKPSA